MPASSLVSLVSRVPSALDEIYSAIPRKAALIGKKHSPSDADADADVKITASFLHHCRPHGSAVPCFSFLFFLSP
jgi:hypothetical protein